MRVHRPEAKALGRWPEARGKGPACLGQPESHSLACLCPMSPVPTQHGGQRTELRAASRWPHPKLWLL